MATSGVGRAALPPVSRSPSVTEASGSQRTPKGERTRRRLLEAAERVFAERGYHDASIVKITEAAEVGQGTFYLYFRSKQEIFEELVDDLSRQVRASMRRAIAGKSHRRDIERAGLRAFLAFTMEHPALYSVILQADLVSPDAVRRHYESIARPYAAGLARAMDRGEVVRADPEVLAYALMAVGAMIGRRWVLWADGPSAPEVVVSEALAFIERGLGMDDTHARGASARG